MKKLLLGRAEKQSFQADESIPSDDFISDDEPSDEQKDGKDVDNNEED